MNKIGPLNKQEKKFLAIELENRLRDIFFMQSQKRIAEMVQKFSDLTFYEDEKIIFSYEITMLGFDILQIIGRNRRKKSGE